MPRRPLALAAAAVVALAVAPATAPAAPNYPEPKNPTGATGKPKGPFSTLRVCKKGCRYKTIQRAVDAADAGDTIRVGNGRYREGVRIFGATKRYVKVIGNPRAPHRVVIDARGLTGAKAQMAFFVNGADQVTLRGMKAVGQKANGFFVINNDGYTFDRLIAEKTGVYGLYAFNSTGGTMTNSLAYYLRDGAYYIGQTPPQVKPKRTIVRNVVGWGSVLGFSATHMKYVTITQSRFFNNSVGVAPNALDSQKYAPAANNVIRDNDIFWNNFDVYRGAPFNAKSNANFVYPPGTGVILLSGRDNVVEANRIWGHHLGALIEVQNIFLEKNKEAIDLVDNVARNNAFGKGGADRNGRDLIYTGNGTGNCFEGNTGVETTLPADPASFPPCPGPDNQDNQEAIALLAEAGVNKRYRENWIVTERQPIAGIEPLVDYAAGRPYGPTKLAPLGASVTARAAGGLPQRKTVKVGDYFFAPARLTVNRGSRITWTWLDENIDLHDVKLTRAPAGVRKWKSELAATDYTYRRTLRRPGRYRVICTLHPETMVQRITVRR